MSQSPLKSLRRPWMVPAVLIVTGCAVASSAMILSSRRAPATLAKPPQTARTPVSSSFASANTYPHVDGDVAPAPRATPPPDPNFVAPAPLKLPGVTSPEAQRVLLDLQGAYRCLHTGSKRILAAWLPPSAAEAPASLEELSASMQSSLAKLPNACYATTALPQVVNPRTPAVLMEVLYQDLANRPDPIKLRTLFLIAEMDGHPRAAEALENLQSLLNMDYQRDWERWDQAISVQIDRESHGTRGVTCRMH